LKTQRPKTCSTPAAELLVQQNSKDFIHEVNKNISTNLIKANTTKLSFKHVPDDGSMASF
jgi:hypothetical protein